MKTAQVVLIAVAAIAAISIYNMIDNLEPQKETMFKVWMNIHAKDYTSAEK